MKKKNIPSIVTLAVLTVITVFTWIALDVYRALTSKPEPVVPQEILEPLDPTLDQLVLSELQQRGELSESEIGEVIVSITPTPTPEEKIVPSLDEVTTEPSPTPLPTEEDQ